MNSAVAIFYFFLSVSFVFSCKNTLIMSRFILTILCLTITLSLSLAEKHKKQHRTSDAPFLKPAEAVAKMEIPEGFDVSVFAAEPDIVLEG